MSIRQRIAEWVDPAKKWERVAGEVAGAPLRLEHQKQATVRERPSLDEIMEMIIPRSSPASRSARGILAAYHKAPTFQVCARRVAYKMADVEWFVERGGEEVEDHPLVATLKQPNPYFPGWLSQVIQFTYADILGETFDMLFDGPQGLEMWPLPPTAIRRQGQMWDIRLGDFREKVPLEQVLHIPTSPNLVNPYDRGTGIGSTLSDEIETSEYISKHIKSAFFNNARPDFLLHIPGSNQDQQQRFKDAWMARHQGAGKTGVPAIVGDGPEGAISVHELSHTIEDMQTAELRELSDRIIRRTWGLPPEVLGVVENSNRATITAADLLMAKYVITPRAKMWRAAYQHHLMPLLGDPKSEHIDFPNQIPDDEESRREMMAQHPYAFTVNEIRSAAGKPPREDGDVYPREPMLEFIPAGEVEGEVETRRLQDGIVIRLSDVRDAKQKQLQAEAQRIANALQPQTLDLALTEELRDKLRDFAREAFDEFPLDLDDEEMLFLLDPHVQDYVDEFSTDKIPEINETTRTQIRDTINDGFAQGLNPRDIRDEIGSYVEETIPNRGEVIARTEMIGAQNEAREQTFAESGLVEFKRWLSSIDGRQRGDHELLDGQTVPFDEPFVVPANGEHAGATAMHPGDFGVAELDIQCRCGFRAVFPEIEDRSMDDLTIKQRIAEQFENAVEDFKSVAVAALQEQVETQVLPAFDEVFSEELAS